MKLRGLKQRPPRTDVVEEREREIILQALGDVVTHDVDFQRWWAIYRNRHWRIPVVVMPTWYLPTHRGTVGTYHWDFHMVCPLSATEMAELLVAMTRLLHEALDPLGVVIDETDNSDPSVQDPHALVLFHVAVNWRERRRRLRARRASCWWYGLQNQTWRAIEAAAEGEQSLPPCPFCGTRIFLVERNDPESWPIFDVHCETSKCFKMGIGPSRNLLPKIRQITSSLPPES